MKQLFLALMMLPLVAAAQPKLPEGYFWKRLSNGLEVVVIENSKVPLATIEIAVKNGAYTEGPEYSGLSHLFEHMFFKANKEYPNQERFLERTQELGAIWNGTTDVERVNYYFTFDKDSLEAGLRFMNAAIRFPVYRKEDMAKERPVVDGEFQRAESDPYFTLWFECQKKLWGDLVTRKNPIGDHEIINTATPEKMMIIKGKYYHPNNSLLVVCGDVKHEVAFSYVAKIFGSWERSGFDPHEKYPIPEFKPLDGTRYFVSETSIAQTPYISYFWQGPDFRNDSAATIAADVFNTLLRLNSSKWKQAVINSGLASYSEVSYQTARYVGPVSIFLVPNPEKLKTCHEVVLDQIRQWMNADYFTDEQLATAKEVMRRNFIRQNEKPSSLASQLTFQWCSTSLNYFTDYPDACMRVTREDILRYIKNYIADKPYVAGMVISPEMNQTVQAGQFFQSK